MLFIPSVVLVLNICMSRCQVVKMSSEKIATNILLSLEWTNDALYKYYMTKGENYNEQEMQTHE